LGVDSSGHEVLQLIQTNLYGFPYLFKKVISKLINIDSTNISIRYEKLKIDMKEYQYDMKE